MNCYLHSMKITNYCDVTAGSPCSAYELKEICLRTKENLIEIKFNGFKVEYVIDFTGETPSVSQLNKFHIQRLTIKFPLFISHCNVRNFSSHLS